ncbi:MAG: hypothetical protein WBO73_11040 [Gammaproteobacteria bacterium]
MPQEETIKLSLWDKEPLMRLLAKRLTPASLGIYFFVCVSLPLCILAYAFHRGFFENISWSITVVFLFPFLAWLGFKYYEEIPKLFDHLFEVYNRALAAWESVAKTDIGVAAQPQAYQSAWEIGFDGNLGPLVSDMDSSQVAPKIAIEAGLAKACSLEGDRCPQTSEHAVELVQSIRLSGEIAGFYGQPVIVGLAAKVREINNEWDRFLFQSKPMYPWSLRLTDVLNRRESSYDKKLGLRAPPDTQYFFLHPAPGFSYINNANDGEQLQPSVYVELFGINKWRKKYFTGVSAIVEYADRSNMDDVGWGALFTFSNKFSFANTSNDGDVGVTFGLDLANFYKEQLKPQIESIKTGRSK